MNALRRLSNPSSRLQTIALIAIVGVGAAARVYVMSHYQPAPGDGLLRALMADWWVRGLWPLDITFVDHGYSWTYMRLPIAGPWLPGHFVLAGLFVLVFQDPVFATSLLSLALGILSIPLLYYVATKTFGSTVGFVSATTLALLPLHITLSTNPLTEAPAVFFLLAVLAVVLKGTEAGFPPSRLFALAILTLLGTMIRYELWLLLPVISAAYWYRQRTLWRTCLVSILISLGPLLWMLAAWIHYGNLLASFRGPLSDADRVGAVVGIALTAVKLSAAVGYFIVVASAFGAMLVVIGLRFGRRWVEKTIYISAALSQLMFLAWFTSQRGINLWDRYVLIAAVLIIPLAGYALLRDSSQVSRYLAAATIIGSMLFAIRVHHGYLYIRRSVPDAVSEAAAWLQDRLDPGETFITTRLGGDAHMIDLLTRSTPYNVAYDSFSAKELAATWNSVQPSYVVILAGEEPGDRLLQKFASQIDLPNPLVEFGQISIYRVKHD